MHITANNVTHQKPQTESRTFALYWSYKKLCAGKSSQCNFVRPLMFSVHQVRLKRIVCGIDFFFLLSLVAMEFTGRKFFFLISMTFAPALEANDAPSPLKHRALGVFIHIHTPFSHKIVTKSSILNFVKKVCFIDFFY